MRNTSWGALHTLHLPHDEVDDPHDDLTQYIEEVDHDFGLVTHLPDDDAEHDAETDQT